MCIRDSSHRDEGWHLIRSAWLGEPEGRLDVSAAWSDGQPLQDAYEAAVGNADDIADRLRHEAQAVERRATLERSIKDVGTELKSRNESLDELRTAADAAEADWLVLWRAHGIVAQTPTAVSYTHLTLPTILRV